MKKIISISATALGLLLAASVSAHVIVRPNQVGIGETQVFTVSVPSEKDIPTTALKLMIPDGLEFVVPTIQAGWQVRLKTVATGKKITDDDGMMVDEMKPTEIDWTGGSIPAGLRNEFTFQAQAPPTPTTLDWKAYQTYQDGSIVSWDETPSNTSENPYSVTLVINDLSAAPKVSWRHAHEEGLALALSILALIVSGVALVRKSKA